MHTPNWLELDDMTNVRDVGGLPTADGRTTRHGIIIRGETPDDLAAADVEHLVERLRLTRAIDLRMTKERPRTATSPLRDAGVDVVAFPLWENPAVAEAVRKDVPDGEGYRVMASFYLKAIDGFRERAGELLELLLTTSGATLIHCTGGKDRTGMITALLLGAVGVPDETIIADYGATELRLERLYQRLSRLHAMEYPPKFIPTYANGADPQVMRFVIADLKIDHGTLRQWWRDAGVDEPMLEAWSGRFAA
ncbi:MAG: tyrosine-protein phosphatase [Acidimicrobiia bacterium]